MADEISTHLQREVGQQQKELERIEAKFDGSVGQLRSDVERLRVDMMKMFEQIMSRLDREKGQTKSVEKDSHGKTAIESPFLVSGQSMVTKE